MQSTEMKKQVKAWSGEPLWKGRPATGRAVRITLRGKKFIAVGTVGRVRVFQVSGSVEVLQRFYRQMTVDGAEIKGLKPRWDLAQHRLAPVGQRNISRGATSGEIDLDEIPPEDPREPSSIRVTTSTALDVNEIPPEDPREPSANEIPPEDPREPSSNEIPPEDPREPSLTRVTASTALDLNEIPPEDPREPSVNEIPPEDPREPSSTRVTASAGKARAPRRQRPDGRPGRGARRGQKRRGGGSRRAAS